MPEYMSFFRSIRIRYLSGLLILALSVGGVIAMLNHANSYRHHVDTLSAHFVAFSRDLNNAASFAETAVSAWRPDTRAAHANAAAGPAPKLVQRLDALALTEQGQRAARLSASQPQLRW